MHPLIAKYLDLTQLQNALATTEEADAFHTAVRAAGVVFAAEQKTVLAATAQSAASSKVQAAQMFLLTEATLTCLRSDPECAAAMQKVEQAFVAQGATRDEVTPLLGAAVLEEALGYADDPDVFDRPFLLETLQSLIPLASLTEDTLDAWVEHFSKSGDKKDVALRLTVAQTLFETAYGDGPALISAETVDDATEALTERVAAADIAKAGETLVELLNVLSEKSLIGVTRLNRLANIALVGSRAAGFEFDDENGDENENENEDEDSDEDEQ
jgi:hypothetical protein